MRVRARRSEPHAFRTVAATGLLPAYCRVNKWCGLLSWCVYQAEHRVRFGALSRFVSVWRDDVDVGNRRGRRRDIETLRDQKSYLWSSSNGLTKGVDGTAIRAGVVKNQWRAYWVTMFRELGGRRLGRRWRR